MNVFSRIIKSIEKSHLEARNMRFFKNCLTDEEKKYFNENDKKLTNDFCANYDDLLGFKWRMNGDASMLYKVDENVQAYLVRSENGYIIDPNAEQTLEAIAEENYLLAHAKDIVQNLYNHVIEYEDFHTRDWQTKPDVDRQMFEFIAQELGYLKGKEVSLGQSKKK